MKPFKKAPFRLEYLMDSHIWNDKTFFNEGLIKTYNPQFCMARLQSLFSVKFGIKLINLNWDGKTSSGNVDSSKSYIFINYPDNRLSDEYCDGIYSKLELGIYRIGMFIYVDNCSDTKLKQEEFKDVIELVCGFCGMFISKKDVYNREDGGYLFKFVIEPKFSDVEFQLNKCDEIQFLYHITKISKVEKILKKGLNPKSSNSEFDYPDRIYLGINPDELEKELSTRFKRLNKGVDYAMLRIDISKIPDNVKFNIDPNYSDGIFTSGNIPPTAIDLFKKI